MVLCLPCSYAVPFRGKQSQLESNTGWRQNFGFGGPCAFKTELCFPVHWHQSCVTASIKWIKMHAEYRSHCPSLCQSYPRIQSPGIASGLQGGVYARAGETEGERWMENITPLNTLCTRGFVLGMTACHRQVRGPSVPIIEAVRWRQRTHFITYESQGCLYCYKSQTCYNLFLSIVT